MQSPDKPSIRYLIRLVLAQEIRGLFFSPALWIMLIIISLLVGFSFIQAVNLFSQASKTALTYPDMASGMNPLQGIFIPTFGAYYLSQTLLLPFVAIRVIGRDKESGALKLLLQLPLSLLTLCGLKITALGFVWLISLIPAVSVLLLFHYLGGHIYFAEIVVLLVGHGLYALTISSIAMFAATISDSLSTAAICCLAVTLGSWVLDFAASGQVGILGALGSASMTSMLGHFENGLFSTGCATSFLSMAVLFFLLSVVWLHPGQGLRVKFGKSLGVILLIAVVTAMLLSKPNSMDLTEDQRHSFNPAATRVLKKLDKKLTITIHLAPQDSRLLDLDRDFIAKLRRSVQKLDVKYAKTGSAGLFNAAENENYGLIMYEYNGQRDQSYSNSQNEILPIIYNLAGVKIVAEPVSVYSGYPLVADAAGSRWWFYVVLPLFFLCCGVYGRKGKLMAS